VFPIGYGGRRLAEGAPLGIGPLGMGPLGSGISLTISPLIDGASAVSVRIPVWTASVAVAVSI
jgi:hypothetical protein